MPIFEYKCKECGKISEFLVGVGREAVEIKCSYCASPQLEKIFSRGVISTGGHFIGSQGGKTCCGRTERCEKPPCSDTGICKK